MLPIDAGAGSDMSEPDISGEGRYIVFTAKGADRSATASVWLRDTRTGQTSLVSRADGLQGMPASGESYEPQISDDGRYIAFSSTATNLGAGGRRISRVYLRDVEAGETIEASAGRDGPSFKPSLSGNGRMVAFTTLNRWPGRNGEVSQVFLFDAVAGKIELVSRADRDDGPGWGFSSDASVSADGRYVAFASDSANIFGSRSNMPRGVFVRDRVAVSTTAIGD